MIRYHNISNEYSEFRTNTVITVPTNDFINLLKDTRLNLESSVFEVIGKTNLMKIYMDIEYVANDQVLQKIIDTFKDFFEKYFRFPVGPYVVTKNHYISKKKLHSYHVVFTKYKLRLFDVRNLIRMFVIRHAEFNDYIDLQCYSVDNLFRSVGQYTIDHYNNTRSINFENYHGIYNLREKRFYDEDELSDKLLEETVIQAIDHCEEFTAKIPIQSQAIVNILIGYKKNRCNNAKPASPDIDIQNDLVLLKNLVLALFAMVVMLTIVVVVK